MTDKKIITKKSTKNKTSRRLKVFAVNKMLARKSPYNKT